MNNHDKRSKVPLQYLGQVARTRIGGMQIAVIDRVESARLMIREAIITRRKSLGPVIVTSANGQVLSQYAANAHIRELFDQTDLVHADGMPLVIASRFWGAEQLPERVATTDLFHDMAKLAIAEKATFYMLGADQKTLDAAIANVRKLYPELQLRGSRNGYFTLDDEARIVTQINRCKPDILWVAMGVPREQEFCIRNREKLTNVGLIKTSGGLFDFLSGRRTRAPKLMQTLCLEWVYRIYLEPRRLFWRYLSTNFHSLFLLVCKTKI